MLLLLLLLLPLLFPLDQETEKPTNCSRPTRVLISKKKGKNNSIRFDCFLLLLICCCCCCFDFLHKIVFVVVFVVFVLYLSFVIVFEFHCCSFSAAVVIYSLYLNFNVRVCAFLSLSIKYWQWQRVVVIGWLLNYCYVGVFVWFLFKNAFESFSLSLLFSELCSAMAWLAIEWCVRMYLHVYLCLK